MILNSGLDAACVATHAPGASQIHPFFCEFIRYACFGTGSTAPSASDTSLVAQVGSRSIDRGGFNNTEDAGLDNTENVMWYEATFTRVFEISGNVNAAEWGASLDPTGNLSVRDLFRADPTNPESAPVTLTLETGDQLQVVITFRVEATWEYENKSFVINGTAGNDTTGTHTGRATATPAANSSLEGIRGALTFLWPSNGGLYLHALATSQVATPKGSNFSSNSRGAAPMMLAAYTPGDYYRDVTGVFSTSAAVGDHYGWVMSFTNNTSPVNYSQGLRFVLDDPASLAKESSHRLSLTVRKSISRL